MVDASDRSAPEAMATLKALLEWFKQRFPYYKSACLHCSNHEDNRMIGTGRPPHTPGTETSRSSSMHMLTGPWLSIRWCWLTRCGLPFACGARLQRHAN